MRMPEQRVIAAGTMSAETIERVLLQGDLQTLAPHQRLEYYRGLCQSLDLNPLTKPFEYLLLDKKLVLYAKKDCTEQLRAKRDISIKIVSRELVNDVYVVTAQAATPLGRTDESVGAVPLVKENGSWKSGSEGKRFFQSDGTYAPLSPPDRANAMMKAETKAKRRVTLSICGLGMLDESELDTVGNARRITAEEAHGTETFQQNTPAQQKDFAQERIAQERERSEKQQANDVTLTAEQIEFMKTMARAKKQLGDKAYYGVLKGVYGYDHSNQVKDSKTMDQILGDLRDARDRQTKSADPTPRYEATDEDVPVGDLFEHGVTHKDD